MSGRHTGTRSGIGTIQRRKFRHSVSSVMDRPSIRRVCVAPESSVWTGRRGTYISSTSPPHTEGTGVEVEETWRSGRDFVGLSPE